MLGTPDRDAVLNALRVVNDPDLAQAFLDAAVKQVRKAVVA